MTHLQTAVEADTSLGHGPEARPANMHAASEGEANRVRDALITSHLGLVVAIAKRYADRGVGLQDLIAEGNAGLVRAAARFDSSREIRFSSYAYPWVEHAIRAACLQCRDVITVPPAMKRLVYAYRRLEASREPGAGMSLAEVARELDIPVEEAATVMATAHGARTISARDEAHDALKFVANPSARELSDPLEQQDMAAAVASALDALPRAERQVVAMYFGLDGESPSTRASIACELGMLSECVEWTLNRALNRLRVTLARQAVA